MRAYIVSVLLPTVLTGCTGLSLNENQAGTDVYLGFGDIAVDDRTEASFIRRVHTVTDPETAKESSTSILIAVDPDTGAARDVADLTNRDDPRLLFPKTGVLVMSETAGHDRLELLDKDTFAPITSEDAMVRYHGTRMSPSRSWIAVADNTSDKAPIHILDTEMLKPTIIPHDGEWLEAMWMNGSDELLAIVFYKMNTPDAYARILAWSMAEVSESGFKPDTSGFWPNPKFDISVDGMTSDLAFSFTWVGISPDDHWAVFPVRDVRATGADAYALLVVDTTTSDVRKVKNAKGPVGFTPDSSTIVSYNDSGDQPGDQRLLLIDVASLGVDPQDVPIKGGMTYFISRDGNFVVVGSSVGGQRLALYDVDQDKITQMDGPGVGLFEFVSRKGKGEMWMVDQEELFRLDLLQGVFEPINTDFAPQHINILPKRDRLVLDGSRSDQLFFFDPTARKTTLIAELPKAP
jgi:hypothetical protein